MDPPPLRTPTTPLYDDPEFYAAYATLRSQPGRINDVVEQPALRSLLPSLVGRDVADLGCGTGGMSRWALLQGARSVIAVDASDRMLAEARSLGGDPDRLRFVLSDIDRLELEPGSLDVVMSGLALHYVVDFGQLARRIATALRPGGAFVFSVEHPMTTCTSRAWTEGAEGERLHWPVDRYFEEGSRNVRWLGADTPREHRTVATYINAVVDSGLTIACVLEPSPSAADVERWPHLADHARRPAFLIIRADRALA